MFSRTASCIAQTAAGLDFVSDGRFVLGLGASGPQVIEGFHGVPYEQADAAHPRLHQRVPHGVAPRAGGVRGAAVQVPLPAGQGTGLAKPLKLINHPVRSEIPIFWAA